MFRQRADSGRVSTAVPHLLTCAYLHTHNDEARDLAIHYVAVIKIVTCQSRLRCHGCLTGAGKDDLARAKLTPDSLYITEHGTCRRSFCGEGTRGGEPIAESRALCSSTYQLWRIRVRSRNKGLLVGRCFSSKTSEIYHAGYSHAAGHLGQREYLRCLC